MKCKKKRETPGRVLSREPDANSQKQIYCAILHDSQLFRLPQTRPEIGGEERGAIHRCLPKVHSAQVFAAHSDTLACLWEERIT